MAKFTISGFYDEISSDLNKQIKAIKEMGLNFLSLRYVNGRNIANFSMEEFKKEILPVLQENDVKVSSIASPIGLISINDNDEYENQLNQLRNLVEFCKLSNCKYIRIFSFYVPDDDISDKYHDEVINKLNSFVDIVKDTDIILLHENHEFTYGDIEIRCKKICDEINHPNLRLIFEPASFIRCGINPISAYILLKDYVKYFHINDAMFENKFDVPASMGDSRIEEILKIAWHDKKEYFLTVKPELDDYLQSRNLLKVPLLNPLLYISPKYRSVRRMEKNLGINNHGFVSYRNSYKIQLSKLNDIIDKVIGDVVTLTEFNIK